MRRAVGGDDRGVGRAVGRPADLARGEPEALELPLDGPRLAGLEVAQIDAVGVRFEIVAANGSFAGAFDKRAACRYVASLSI